MHVGIKTVDPENKIESTQIIDAIKTEEIEAAEEGIHNNFEIEAGNEINNSTEEFNRAE